MAKGEVWNQTKDLLVVGNRHVAQARLFIAQDDTKPLEDAFEMLVSLRFLGAQIDNDTSNHFSVRNGSVATNVNVTNPPTVVKGTIVNWHGVEGKIVNNAPVPGHGNTVTPGSDWSKVSFVGFTLVGDGAIGVPVAAILSAIPSVNFAMMFLGTTLPIDIPIELSVAAISIPIHRNAAGKVVLPPNSVTPAWWP
jgi:hypothetical protein